MPGDARHHDAARVKERSKAFEHGRVVERRLGAVTELRLRGRQLRQRVDGNRAVSLAIRLGSMMAVVLAGVFAATLIDLSLGLQTRFQGLGILATYLVVLAVILAPSLNPRTGRQWIVVIGGFAVVILAIALGSAVARLMLMTKDFQHTGLYVHLAVEFGVMFAFWGLASLVFVDVLRRVGINIGGG